MNAINAAIRLVCTHKSWSGKADYETVMSELASDVEKMLRSNGFGDELDKNLEQALDDAGRTKSEKAAR